MTKTIKNRMNWGPPFMLSRTVRQNSSNAFPCLDGGPPRSGGLAAANTPRQTLSGRSGPLFARRCPQQILPSVLAALPNVAHVFEGFVSRGPSAIGHTTGTRGLGPDRTGGKGPLTCG